MPYQKQAKEYPILGGVRTDKALTQHSTYDAVQALNTRLSKFGSARSRRGGSKYNTTQLSGAENVLGLYNFKYGSTSKFLICEDEYIYTDDGTTRTQIASSMDTSAYYWFDSYDDYCWINNGVDKMQKYNGTTVTQASLDGPGAHCVVAVGAAGVLTGDYEWLVTFYVQATGQESQPYTLATAPGVTLAAQQGALSVIPTSSDSQVDARRIYRTTAGGSIYNAQRVTTINDNTTTTYNDNIADADLGSLISLDNDPAPVLKKMVIHKNHGFGFGDPNHKSRLYISARFNMWYWPQGLIDLSDTQKLYYIDINIDDGDEIVNVVKYSEYLLIWKNNSVYIMYGNNIADFGTQEIKYERKVGCVSKRAAVVAGNWCYFLDSNGIYSTNGQMIQYIGKPVEAYFDPNNNAADELVNSAQLQNAVMEINTRKPNTIVMLSVPTGSSSVNNITFIYDYEMNAEDPLMAWTVDTGYKAQCWALKEVGGLDTLIRGDDYGYVWTEDTLNGDGALIASTATSGGASTLTDTSQSMTVDLYKGCYIEILVGPGVGERFKITANTSDTFTIDGAWDTQPDDTSEYTVGGIDWNYQHGWDKYDSSAHSKRLNYIRPRMDTTGDYAATVSYYWDFQIAASEASDASYVTGSLSLYDVSLWNVATWDAQSITLQKIRAPGGHIHHWGSVGFSHKKAGQPMQVNGFDKIYQMRVSR